MYRTQPDKPFPTDGHVYTALGFPNSESNDTDTIAMVVKPSLWSYSATTLTDTSALIQKLGGGDDHLFIKFDVVSRTESGQVVSSLDPVGMSGGALFDLGNLARPEAVQTPQNCQAKLVGLKRPPN